MRALKALAAWFRRVADIEKAHEERYRALLKNVRCSRYFEKGEETIGECRVCGHLVMGKKAPEVCPVCKNLKHTLRCVKRITKMATVSGRETFRLPHE